MRPLPAALSLAFAGCLTPGLVGDSASDWYELGPVRRPLAELMQVSRDTVARLGYQVQLLAQEIPARLETGWDVHLSPHWREGYRTMVEIEFEELPGAGGVLVRIRSRREINDYGTSPTMPEKAQWISGSLDDKHKPKIPEMALKVRQLLKFKFETKS